MADRAGTLTAAQVATVEVTARNLEVLNRSGTSEIWVTVDGPTPTVADTDPDVFCIPAVAGAARVFRHDTVAERTIRLISSGTPTYAVQPL